MDKDYLFVNEQYSDVWKYSGGTIHYALLTFREESGMGCDEFYSVHRRTLIYSMEHFNLDFYGHVGDYR